MITIRKLASLKKKTALRKVVSLLQGFEVDLAAGKSIDTGYLAAIVKQIVIPADPSLADPAADALSKLAGAADGAADGAAGALSKLSGAAAGAAQKELDTLRRVCNDLRHLLRAYLGIRPADWDLMPPPAPAGSPNSVVGSGTRAVLPIRVFLEDLRSPFNVGSIFRSAESFCVERVILTPSCPRPDHPRAARSAMGSNSVVPWSIGGWESLEGANVFALETGGTPIEDFDFPDEGAVILGNEELGVSPEGLEVADKSSGVVSIPLFGGKASLNVTAAFAILIYFWCARIRGRFSEGAPVG